MGFVLGYNIFILVNWSEENKHAVILVAAKETFEKFNIYYLKYFLVTLELMYTFYLVK